jgi:hypothetical protein
MHGFAEAVLSSPKVEKRYFRSETNSDAVSADEPLPIEIGA